MSLKQRKHSNINIHLALWDDSVKFWAADFPPKQLLGPANIIIQPGAGGRSMDSVVLLATLVNGAETSLMQISVYSIFYNMIKFEWLDNVICFASTVE